MRGRGGTGARCLRGCARALAMILALANASAVVRPLPALAAQTNVSILGNAGDRSYSPAAVTVNPGDTVDWFNRDPQQGAKHNAFCDSSCPESFSTALVFGNQDSGTFTFRYSGTYHYYCAAHGSTMAGTVTVTGDVHPPSQGASSRPSGTGASSTPTSGAAAAGAGSPGSGHATPSATAAQGPAPVAVANSSADPSATPDAAAGAIEVPEPKITFRTSAGHSTPLWMVVVAALLVLASGALFLVAWSGMLFHPREAERK